MSAGGHIPTIVICRTCQTEHDHEQPCPDADPGQTRIAELQADVRFRDRIIASLWTAVDQAESEAASLRDQLAVAEARIADLTWNRP